MKLPEDMPEELKRMLEHLAEKAGVEIEGIIKCGKSEHRDTSNWAQVGVLTGPERLESKNYDRRMGQIKRKNNSLELQSKKLELEARTLHEKFWAMLYDNHHLPENRDYHITEDNRILMKPKGDK